MDKYELKKPCEFYPQKKVSDIILKAINSKDYKTLKNMTPELPWNYSPIVDNDDNTLLHKAVKSSDLTTVELVAKMFHLELGRGIMAWKNKDGYTALDLAVEKGYKGISSYLFRKVYDFNRLEIVLHDTELLTKKIDRMLAALFEKGESYLEETKDDFKSDFKELDFMLDRYYWKMMNFMAGDLDIMLEALDPVEPEKEIFADKTLKKLFYIELEKIYGLI